VPNCRASWRGAAEAVAARAATRMELRVGNCILRVGRAGGSGGKVVGCFGIVCGRGWLESCIFGALKMSVLGSVCDGVFLKACVEVMLFNLCDGDK